MRTTRRLLTAIVTAATLGAGVIVSADTAGASPSYTWTGRPSPVVLQPPGRDVRLEPVSSCWTAPPHHGTSSEVCSAAAGRDPWAHAPTVRTTHGLRFWFGMPRWRFTARLTRYYSGHSAVRRAVRVAPRHFRLSRPAVPGLFKVVLFGTGPWAVSAAT